MKTWFASLAIGLSLLTMSAAPAVAQQAPAAPAAAPNVQSVDILNQNQMERTRDQPGNAAPTWRQVKSGEKGYSSLPDPEAGVLIQQKAQFPGQSRATTAGEAWRQYRNGPMIQIGGWLLLIAIIAIAAVYFFKGPIRLTEHRTGRLIERFTSVERIAHWAMAISFVILAFTGIVMLFGKYVLLPVFGYTLFGWLAYASKNIHNFVGPVFTVSTIVFFIIYVKDNLPHASDVKWIKRMGGAIGKGHVSAGRFNAGEKLWFWGGVVALGIVVSTSGFVLNMIVPGLQYDREMMQIANLVHLGASVLVIAMSFAHIYIGTIGMEGAYQAMRSGYVDDTWAREHHDLWYEQIEKGEIPRVRTQDAPPAGSSVLKEKRT
jgi:formate dehydrogenase subunit gamma